MAKCKRLPVIENRLGRAAVRANAAAFKRIIAAPVFGVNFLMGHAMLLGLVLFYVGAVLILNGLWMLEFIGDHEIWVINLFVGTVSLLVALRQALGVDADATAIKTAALSLLFSLTYLWVAANRLTSADGRGLGWFSLFVAITAVPVAIDTLGDAQTAWEVWSGLSWAAWSVLWLMFFIQLVLRKPVTRMTGWLAIVQGVLTGWLPGYLLLTGALH